MAEDTTAKRVLVRIGVIPESGVRRALSGVVDQMKRAHQQAAAEQVRSARDKDRQLRQIEAGLVTFMGEKERAKQEAMKATERVAVALARTQAREAEKASTTMLRAAEKTAREEQRLMRQTASSRRQIMMGVGGALYGAATGGAAYVGGLQSMAGIGSQEQHFQTAVAFQKSLTFTAGEAGVSDQEREAVSERMLKASEDTAVPLMHFAEALSVAQVNFDAFRQFAAGMPELAKIAAGKNIPLVDLVSVLGAAKIGLGISTTDDMVRYAGKMVATSERGSVEAGAFARDIGPIQAGYAQQTGRTGYVAASELMAFTQVLGKMNPNAGEIATQIESFLFALKEPETRQAMAESGVTILNEEGKLRGIADIATQMANSPEFLRRYQTLGVPSGGIFGRKEAYRGAVGLVNAVTQDPEAFLKLQNLDPQAGLDSASNTLQDIKQRPVFKLEQMEAAAQAKTVRDVDRIAAAIAPSVQAMTELEAEFPLLTKGMGVLGSTIQGSIAALIASNLLTAGGDSLVGKALGAGGSAAGGLLARLGLGGLGGAVLGAGAQVAGAGLAGYGITTGLLKLLGGDVALEKFGAGFADDGSKRTNVRGMGDATGASLASEADRAEQKRLRAPATLADDMINVDIQTARRHAAETMPKVAPTELVTGKIQIELLEEGGARIKRADIKGPLDFDVVNAGRW